MDIQTWAPFSDEYWATEVDPDEEVYSGEKKTQDVFTTFRYRASIEKKDLTSRVTPVGGRYSPTDFSTSSPISSQRGENSPLPRPTSPPDLLPCSLLGLGHQFFPFDLLLQTLFLTFGKKTSACPPVLPHLSLLFPLGL